MDQDAQASWSLVTGCYLVCPLNVKSCDFVTLSHSCTLTVGWVVHPEQQPAVWLAGSGCVSSHRIIFVGVEHYRMTCRRHPLLFFLWVWQSFRWPLTAYRGSRFSDASAVWTQNITERSVYHRMVCHAFLHGCQRLFLALLRVSFDSDDYPGWTLHNPYNALQPQTRSWERLSCRVSGPRE